MQVQNMYSYMRNKEWDKAKASADAAAENESTKTLSKMWFYRGHVYRGIFKDTSRAVKNLDPEAAEKSLEAYVNCLKFDKSEIYKDTIQSYLTQAANTTNKKAANYVFDKQYDKALHCYDLLELAVPYDFKEALKRNNVTKDKIIYGKFDCYRQSGNKEKTKEYAAKLMDMRYKEPKIYTDMVKVSLVDRDTSSALMYIERGKLLFEDNMDLINTELDIYLKRNKLDVLKAKLQTALDMSPDNDLFHFLMGNLYQKNKQIAEAEKEFLKAIQLNPNNDLANNNLGVLYYNQAKEWNDKLNNLLPKDPKEKEYNEKVKDYFKKAFTYLEISFEISKDPKTKQVLKLIAARLEDKEKLEKYK